MMFRKLYWVTEEVAPTKSSRVTGVYTSIPDLIHHGLKTVSEGQLRLTLTKLDSENAPLGCWQAPNFEGLEVKIEEFIATDEFSVDQCKSLLNALRKLEVAVA